MTNQAHANRGKEGPLSKPAQSPLQLWVAQSPRIQAATQLKRSIEDSPRLAVAAPRNDTGLPDGLKAGVEALSGVSMDNVRVHYNSSRPAQLNASAYAQGSDIHLAPGQKQHLPHEAWHVVQQAQGRVKPSIQMKHGVSINDEQGLEREADVMGYKALRHGGRGAEASDLPMIQTAVSAVSQRNAFLTSLTNAAGQIDYAVISAAAPLTPGGKLYTAISDAIFKNLRRQAVFEALEAKNLGQEFQDYAEAKNWQLSNLVSIGQDIRSSHSGGAIDSNLPQLAYEAAPPAAAPGAAAAAAAPVPPPGPVAGLSVAPPVRNTLAERANYDWLKDSTTDHTTDPDHPKHRGATAPGAPTTLGETLGYGAGYRLPKAAGRVASYFELGAHKVYSDQKEGKGYKELLSGTRVVYNPFNGQHFVSEHYARQYELINVPLPNAQAAYTTVTNGIDALLANPVYTADSAAGQLQRRKVNVYKAILAKIEAGTF